ncbi:MAG: hypothetical protein CR986_05765 [Ignavibacteriae bacterium]|nr:MAG: hypothetical protein CR986_05765 [Ignavibacteriota bacterium]
MSMKKKNIYYFAEETFEFKKIKSFYTKVISAFLLTSFLFSLIILGGYTAVKNYVYPESEYYYLKNENKKLKNKYLALSSEIETLFNDVDYLKSKEKDLSLSVNLQYDEENYGIGGTSYEKITSTSLDGIEDIVTNVDIKLNKLKSIFTATKDNYSKIERALKDNIELYQSIPAILPAEGAVGDRFGMRMHPILKIRRMHTGIDIRVNTGENVYAPGNGKILKVGNRGGYGLTIEIDHGFGYTTLYAHLSKANVKKGQKVKRGDLIGKSGSSGSLATGPHLHYEVKHNGIHLNPSNFIFDDIKIFDLIASNKK